MDRPRAAARLIGELALAAVALGLVAAVLWSNLAPDVQVEITADGVRVGTAQARRQFGVDGWFAVLAAGGGLLLGVVGLARHRRHPVGTLIALVAAGLAAAAVHWSVGVLLGPDPVVERMAGLAPGSRISMPLEINALAVVLVWPIAALIGALLVAAFLDDGGPRSARLNRRERSEPSSQR